MRNKHLCIEATVRDEKVRNYSGPGGYTNINMQSDRKEKEKCYVISVLKPFINGKKALQFSVSMIPRFVRMEAIP